MRFVGARWAIAIFVLVLPTEAAVLGRVVQAETAAPKLFRGQGFVFVPASDWHVKEASGTAFLAFQHDYLPATITVALLPSELTMLQLEQVKKNYARRFKGWKLSEEGYAQIAGQKSYFIGGRFRQAEEEIQNLQFFVPGKNKRIYVVTFTALFEDYAILRQDFFKMARLIETQD